MTMENQVISSAASQQQLERHGLVVRVEGEKLKTTPVFDRYLPCFTLF